MNTTTNDEHEIDYSRPRKVWTPGKKDPENPWWGPIPLILVENNDLSASEFRVMCLLIDRSNYGKFVPHGQHWLADRISIKGLTFQAAADSLRDRGMIEIYQDPSLGNGQKAIRYKVLWCPSWRNETDDRDGDRWNPDIVLGKATPRHNSGSQTRASRANSPAVTRDESASNAPSSEPKRATKARIRATDTRIRALKGGHPKSNAACKGVNVEEGVLEGLDGSSPDHLDSSSDYPLGTADEVVDTITADTTDEESKVVTDAEMVVADVVARDSLAHAAERSATPPRSREASDTTMPDTVADTLDVIDATHDLWIKVAIHGGFNIYDIREVLGRHPGPSNAFLILGQTPMHFQEHVTCGPDLIEALRDVAGIIETELRPPEEYSAVTRGQTPIAPAAPETPRNPPERPANVRADLSAVQ